MKSEESTGCARPLRVGYDAITRKKSGFTRESERTCRNGNDWIVGRRRRRDVEFYGHVWLAYSGFNSAGDGWILNKDGSVTRN